MKRNFEGKIDIVDAFEDIKAQIRFMSDACRIMCQQEEYIGEESAGGMLVIFDAIHDQIEDVSKVCLDNIDMVSGDATAEFSGSVELTRGGHKKEAP